MTTLRKRASIAMALTAATALALTSCAAADTAPGGTEAEPAAEAEAITALDVIIPADPGGGWDQTGRVLSQVLTDEGIIESTSITNVGGAGGTIGLAQLATVTDPATLMVMGLVMVGAIETNQSENRLEDTTPIARLTDEPLVIVVPANSPYETLEDLVDDMVEKGQGVTITGGSAGGVDHILAGLLLEEAGLSGDEIAENLNYIPNSGGGEATSLIIGNKVSAGISGVGEFVQHVESGDMRALAVSSAEKVDLLPDTPTITEAGYDLVLTNWRGVIAPGDISNAERDELERIVTELHATQAWTGELETRGWADAFLVGDELDAFVEESITDVTATLKNIGLVD